MAEKKRTLNTTQLFYWVCIFAILVTNFLLYTHLKFTDKNVLSLMLQVFLAFSLSRVLYKDIRDLNEKRIIFCSMLSSIVFLISGVIGICFTMDFSYKVHNMITIVGIHGFIYFTFGMILPMVGILLFQGLENNTKWGISVILFLCILILTQKISGIFIDYGYPNFLLTGSMAFLVFLLIQVIASYFIQIFFRDTRFISTLMLNMLFAFYIVASEMDTICFGTTLARDTGWAISYILGEFFSFMGIHCIMAIIAMMLVRILKKTGVHSYY